MIRFPAIRFLALGVLAAAAAACATTSTLPPAVTPAAIEREQRIQRETVLARVYEEQRRLDSLALPLLRAAQPFCGEHAVPWHGFRALEAGLFPAEWQAAAVAAHGFGDTLQVFSTTPGGPAARAGLRPGDRLIRVSEHEVTPGPGAALRLSRWLSRSLPQRDTLKVVVRREGETRRIEIPLETVCAYETVVMPAMEVNAFADGGAVYTTTGMMRFAEDDELRVIIAHEIAHNAMGHIAAMDRNASIGGFVGLLGDILTLAAGDTLPDVTYSSELGAAGANAFSQDFEREADYVAAYILALAGASLDAAPAVFREFGLADPSSIGYASTHPTSAERVVLLEAAIAEIRARQAAGEPLRPTPRDSGPP